MSAIRNYFSGFIVLAAFISPSALHAQSVVLKNAREAPTPIAIQGFLKGPGPKDLGTAPVDIESNLTADLIFSRMFKVISAEALEAVKASEIKGAIENIQVEPFRVAGAQYVVRGRVHDDGGAIMLDGYVFDVLTGGIKINKHYRAKKNKEVASIAHQFGDDIVELVTGQKGLFSTKIAFSYQPPGKRSKEVWMMDFNGRNPVPLVQNGRFNISTEWARDGKYVYFSSSSLIDWNLWKTDLNKHASQVTHYHGSALGAATMPNGHELVISLSKDGNPDIYLLGLDGSIHKRLTAGRGINVEPYPSPDGKRLCFSSDRYGSVHVFSLDIETKEVTRLTRVGTKNDSCVWHPTENLILFSGMDTNRDYDIFAMDDKGNNMERLTYDASWNMDPAFSPDGKLITFSSKRSGHDQIFVAKTDGTQAIAIENLPGDASQPAWSPRLGY